MKILHITSKPSYPIIDGGCFASAAFLRDLVETGHEVVHYAIATPKHPFDIDLYPKEIRDQVEIYSDKLETTPSNIDAFKSLFTNKSYHISRFEPTEKSINLKTLKNYQFDLIIADSLFSIPTAEYLDSNVPICLRAHNIEYHIWRDALKTTPFYKRPFLSLLTTKLRRREIKTFNKVDRVIAITQVDQLFISTFKANAKFYPVTLSASDDEMNYDHNELFHIGGLNWLPNYHAVKFLSEIIQIINKDEIVVKLNIAGSHQTGEFHNPKMGIFEVGFVDDAYQFGMEKGILVSPIFEGSGVRIKILEMAAHGIPVITSSKGAMGITSNQHMLIAETQVEFIHAIKKLITDKELRKQLGENGKEYIKRQHDFHIVQHKLNAILEEAKR